jgi:large subunit ribosomal protein L17
MRHGWKFRKLGRDTVHRKALLKNLATALIKHERIVTTLAKAKELRCIGDKMITLGKRNTPGSRAEAERWMREHSLVPKLFGDLRQRYQSRLGGYTRLLRIPNRAGDNAKMAVIELVDNPLPPLREPRKHASASEGMSPVPAVDGDQTNNSPPN